MGPRFAIIIPARFASTRYAGKPLAELRGAGGKAKSLIRRSWEAATSVCDPGQVWVATDDRRIADAVSEFGGKVAMTPSSCRNGTERCAAALDQIPDETDIIVNLQGDAPLTPSWLVRGLIDMLSSDSELAMCTPAIRCSPTTYTHLLTDDAAGRVGGTTVVFDRSGHALYFSKRILPYVSPEEPTACEHVHLHLGLYVYHRSALIDYAMAPPSALEEVEGLEQLRFLDQSRSIGVMPVEPLGWDCIELNNPSDVPAIEAVLAARGIE